MDIEELCQRVRESLDTLYHYTVEPKQNPGRTYVRQEGRNALGVLAEVAESALAALQEIDAYGTHFTPQTRIARDCLFAIGDRLNEIEGAP